MMKEPKTNRRVRSDSEWAELIQQQKASGLSLAAWCRKNSVVANSLRQAGKRLSVKNFEADVNTSVAQAQSSQNEWKEIKVPETTERETSNQSVPGVLISYNHIQILFSKDTAPAYLAGVISELSKLNSGKAYA